MEGTVLFRWKRLPKAERKIANGSILVAIVGMQTRIR